MQEGIGCDKQQNGGKRKDVQNFKGQKACR